MKIAIQGGPASFHWVVACGIFGSEAELVYCETFNELFESLRTGVADQAVCACENSLYGTINEVYDLLLKHRFPITGEHIEHIHQQLIGWKGAGINDIKEVYSHPVALNQCRLYLESILPNAGVIEYNDTAEAVLHIKEKGLKNAAAIAGVAAAEMYGMKILDRDIEDEKTNLTRFLVLNPSQTKTIEGANRASLVLTTANKPGALYEALGLFAKADINLTKLESRPIRGEAFRYQFFITADASKTQLEDIFAGLKQQSCEVVMLGHYPASE